MHAVQILTGETAFHVGVGAHAHEHRVELFQQFIDGHVGADIGVEAELDAHALEHFAALGHHRLFQLELGNAEGQQAADFRIAVEHHRLNTIAYQHVGAADARRAGADHRHPLVGPYHLGHVRPPAHGQCRVGDVLLGGTDGHRAEAVVERAGAFTETVLRANAAAHFRQGVGLVRQLHRFHQVAFADQLQPVGDVVVHRALPLAVRVAAVQTAMRLVFHFPGFIRVVDFLVAVLALLDVLFLRVHPGDIKKLEMVV